MITLYDALGRVLVQYAPHEANHASGGSDPFLSTDLLEAIVKRLQESSGPTTLTLGSIADGLTLKRSGSTVIGATAGVQSSMPVNAQTSAYTVDATDFGKVVHVTSGTFTLALTAAATLATGFFFGVKNGGSGVVTIDPNASETIDGAATLALNTGDECLVFCNGSNFFTVAYSIKAGTAANQLVRLDSSAKLPAVDGSQLTNLSAGVSVVRSYLAGYGCANGTDAVNDIDISPGTAADLANAVMITLGATLTKQLDAAWAVGTNAGGLDIGTIANGTYHYYVIRRSDTGVVDVLASRNPGRASAVTITVATPGVVSWADHGLQVGSSVVFSTTGTLPGGLTPGTRYFVIAGGLTVDAFEVSATEGGSAINTTGSVGSGHTATANPVLPTSYDAFRLIASWLRAGNTLAAIVQDGDLFQFVNPTTLGLDINVSNISVAAAVTRTLNVPVGVRVVPIINSILINNTANNFMTLYFSDLSTTDVAANTSASSPLGQLDMSDPPTASGEDMSQISHIPTNHAGQIRTRAAGDASNMFKIQTTGWVNRRGRDN